MLSPPYLAFPLSTSSVYLFVGDSRWKEGPAVKWMSGAVRDLSKVKGFLCSDGSESGWLNSNRLPAPFEFFSLLLPFSQLHLLPFLNVFLLPSTTFFFFYLNLDSVYFSHCPLFPAAIVCLSFVLFWCQSCLDVSRCSVSLPSYALCYLCITQTKGSSSGLDANQVSPFLLLDPWRFQIHMWQILPLSLSLSFFLNPLFVSMATTTSLAKL